MQDDWVKLLPTAEFAYNNNLHTSTGVSPFKANYGFNVNFTDVPLSEKCQPSIEQRIDQIKNVQRELKDAMNLTQELMKMQYNTKIRETPMWKKCEKVWLNSKHLSTTRPTAKFAH